MDCCHTTIATMQKANEYIPMQIASTITYTTEYLSAEFEQIVV